MLAHNTAPLPEAALRGLDLDYTSLDGMRIGSTAGGEIGPFSALKLVMIIQ